MSLSGAVESERSEIAFAAGVFLSRVNMTYDNITYDSSICQSCCPIPVMSKQLYTHRQTFPPYVEVISLEHKPPYKIPTRRPLTSTGDVKHTVVAKFSFSFDRNHRLSWKRYEVGPWLSCIINGKS